MGKGPPFPRLPILPQTFIRVRASARKARPEGRQPVPALSVHRHPACSPSACFFRAVLPQVAPDHPYKWNSRRGAQLSSLARAGHAGVPQAPPLRGRPCSRRMPVPPGRNGLGDQAHAPFAGQPCAIPAADPLQKLSLPLPACRFRRAGPAPFLKFIHEIPVDCR